MNWNLEIGRIFYHLSCFICTGKVYKKVLRFFLIILWQIYDWNWRFEGWWWVVGGRYFGILDERVNRMGLVHRDYGLFYVRAVLGFWKCLSFWSILGWIWNWTLGIFYRDDFWLCILCHECWRSFYRGSLFLSRYHWIVTSRVHLVKFFFFVQFLHVYFGPVKNDIRLGNSLKGFIWLLDQMINYFYYILDYMLLV